MSEHTAVITSRTGRRFLVRILRAGDRYGLDDCLTWADGGRLSPSSDVDRPGVEFYDLTYANTTRPDGEIAFGPRGQFVSRYYVDTLLGNDRNGAFGLDLHGGIDVWKIDAAAMTVVRAWLRHETGYTR